ncbi:hypothetical protein ACLOJK_038837 [Asimina triloba]
MGVVRFDTKSKLSPKYISLYEILDRIGKMAYRLALPPSLQHLRSPMASDFISFRQPFITNVHGWASDHGQQAAITAKIVVCVFAPRNLPCPHATTIETSYTCARVCPQEHVSKIQTVETRKTDPNRELALAFPSRCASSCNPTSASRIPIILCLRTPPEEHFNSSSGQIRPAIMEWVVGGYNSRNRSHDQQRRAAVNRGFRSPASSRPAETQQRERLQIESTVDHNKSDGSTVRWARAITRSVHQ